MTIEEILKTYLEDPLFFEKKYITKEKIQNLKFIGDSGVKLIEVVKIAIKCSIEDENESTISRKINKFLNK